ncbi:MAG: DMT family transporter [Candidatus Altiarchaeota archaeon]|nr:DMT family transporter [Candidatus Altiarchaeota archaeon]
MDKKFYFMIVLAAFFYSMYLIINRVYLVDGLFPLNFACGSGLSAAFFSSVFLIFSKKIEEVKRLDRKDLTHILILGLVVGFFFRLILFFGQSLTTATNAGFLLRTAPLFALMFGYIFMREFITKKHMLMMLIMLSGVYLLTTGGKLIPNLGDLLLISGGVIIGFDQAFSRKMMRKGVAPDVLTSLTMITGGILLYLFVIIFSSFSFIGWEIYLLSGLLIFLSVFARNLGLRHIKAGITSSILLLNPVFTAIMGIGLLHERITSLQLLGGVIILLGGYLIIRIKS